VTPIPIAVQFDTSRHASDSGITKPLAKMPLEMPMACAQFPLVSTAAIAPIDDLPAPYKPKATQLPYEAHQMLRSWPLPEAPGGSANAEVEATHDPAVSVSINGSGTCSSAAPTATQLPSDAH
jgi:hypothetical protein